MKSVESKAEIYAKYMLDYQSTLRQTATHFGVSKSTVHSYVTYKLPKINKRLYRKVHKLLIYNFQIKHIRGGLSTAKRYKKTG